MTMRSVAALGAMAIATLANAHNESHIVLVSLDGAPEFTPSAAAIEIGDTVQWNFVTSGYDVSSGVAGTPDGIFKSQADMPGGSVFKVTFDEAFLAANPAPNNVYHYFCDGTEGMAGTVRVLTESDKNAPSWRNVEHSIFAVWEFDTAVAVGAGPLPLMEVGDPPLQNTIPTEIMAMNGATWSPGDAHHPGFLTMAPGDSVSFGFEFWPDPGTRTARVQYVHDGPTSHHQLNLFVDGQPDPVSASVVTTSIGEGWYHTTLEFLSAGPSGGPHGGRWELILSDQSIDGVVVDYANGVHAATAASHPHPVSGAIGVNSQPILRWSPGVGAVSHDVYLGETITLNEAHYHGTTASTSFVPASALNDGQTYYWRIDEFDGSQTTTGDVWSFTVTQASMGSWSAPIDIGVMAGHTVLTPTGSVISWQYPFNKGGDAISYYFDPNAPLAGVQMLAPADVFCAGMSVLPDGRVLATGSNLSEPLSNFFDPMTSAWTVGPAMQGGRFYPSTIVQGDGTLLSFGGLDFITEEHDLTIEKAPADGSSWALVGGEDVPEEGEEAYARLHLLSDGRIFMSGQSPRSYVYDPATLDWSLVAQTNHPLWRAEGSSVRLFDGRILIAGGHDLDMFGGGTFQPTATAEIIDPEAPVPTWQSVQSLPETRTFHDFVLLPDGTALCVGGALEKGKGGELLTPHLFDPIALTWSPMAAHQELRGYHSTATILPDARVMIGGTDGITTVEFFSPPYLFAGPRPLVTNAPASASYGQQIQVEYSSSDSVTSAVLLRPGCITHSFSYNQIGVPVTFDDFGSFLQLDIPSNPNLTPPGFYLLFLVSDSGVPSIAPFILLGPGSPCPPDVNGDSIVNVTDLLALLANFGPCAGCPSDLNNDGNVDVVDLLALLAAWGPCP